MKKEFLLSGLNCSSCGEKIQSSVNKLDYVDSADFNITNQKLTVSFENIEDKSKIFEDVKSIVNHYEPDVLISEYDKNTSNDNDENKSEKRIAYIKFAISILLFGAGMIFKFKEPFNLIIYLVAYLLIGFDVLLSAIKKIAKGEIFDENFLMSIATIGAFLIGEYAEGVAVMIFYQIGEFFQDMAVDNSRKSIANLMDIRPDYANLIVSEEKNESKKVKPEEVKIGDKIFVKPGEKIPLDGIILKGNSFLDMVALTGESVPKSAREGDFVLAGSINKEGLLTILVEKEFGDSTVSKILHLVENASSKKSKTENFITKFSKIYTPVVVIMAAIIAFVAPIVFQQPFSEWIRRGLVFLVVSCPCALVVSVPLGFFGGIGAASKNGILVKGSNYLEALNFVKTVVFDKTGTLTKGTFKVTKIKAFNNFIEEDVLKYASYGEAFSSHPIGKSILKHYDKDVDTSKISDYKDIAGKGTSILFENKKVLAGSYDLLKDNNIKNLSQAEEIGTVVYISVDNVFAGYILIADEIKDDSKNAIEELHKIGVQNIVMLTGDNKRIAELTGKELGVDKVYSELLPDDKVRILEDLMKNKSEKELTVFVGDGINDAPVIARADVGISMGGVGSDAAIEASDIALMSDEPSQLVKAIKIAKFTRKIVAQNIILALGIKIIVLVLGLFGIVNIWLAVFADVGVALLAILNSIRALKQK